MSSAKFKEYSTAPMMPSTRFKWHFTTFTFLGISLLVYVTFLIVPAIMGFIYSFTSWNGLTDVVNFVGLANYREALADRRLHNAILNSVRLAVIQTLFFNFVVMILAAAIETSRTRVLRGTLRSLFFLPFLVSFVVISVIWTSLLSYRFGVINGLMRAIGLGFFATDWLGTPATAIYSILVINLWAFSGFYLVTYMTAMQAIPKELYESAQIDGARWFQSFRNITFPLVAPAFAVNFIVSLAWGLGTFEPVLLMTQGGPGFASETISYYIYWFGFMGARQGYGTAVSFLLFLATMIISVIQVYTLGRREVE